MSLKKKPGEGGLVAFVSALMPNFEKSRILEDLNSVHKEMKLTREMLAVDHGLFNRTAKKTVSDLETELNSHVKGYRGDLIGLIRQVADLQLKEKDDLVDFIDEIYAGVVIRDSMDYRKVHMLRYVDGLSFFNGYARKLILFLANHLVDDRSIASVMDRADEEFINDRRNQRSFAVVVSAMMFKVKDIRKSLDKVGKVSFNSETHGMLSRQMDTDPMRLGLLPVVGSFVYHVGMEINLMMAARQERAKEEREKLRIMVMLLNRKLDGVDDPKERARLEKQLEYHNNRINKLSAKIDDLTEEE